MTYTNRPVYAALCSRVRDSGCIVKLSRAGNAWGLQLLIPPSEANPEWRAAGILFPSLDGLDDEAGHLLRWLESARWG